MSKQLVSIRGAITAKNSKSSIAESARKLVDRVYFKNGITDDDVVNIAVTVTQSLQAASAAQAIREGGHNVPIMSAAEPAVYGMPKNVIRIMVTAYSDNAPHHVYLNGAGKSTVAKLVAKRLGITYLDTGALYRALGLKCIRSGVSTADGAAVEQCLKDVGVDIKYVNGAQCVLLDGEDVSGMIRTPEVSMAASAVSALPFVRQKLLGLQRGIAAESSVILDGRDIGTVVLPNAEFKYFLTASAEIRAKRRYDELTAKGQSVVYEDVYNDVVTRDRNDSTRAVAPLKPAFDAVEINSDELTAEQVADSIAGAVTGDISA